MKTEEAKHMACTQVNEQDENYKATIYQIYALEELRFNQAKAEKFAAEFEEYPCSEQFSRYQTAQEIDRFYFWYYLNHCSQPFSNGFEQWLKVHNLMLQFLAPDWNIIKFLPATANTQQQAERDMYELAKKWANEFELQYPGQDWSRKNFSQTLAGFCQEKLKAESDCVYVYLKYYTAHSHVLIRSILHIVKGESYEPYEDFYMERAVGQKDLTLCFVHPGLMYHHDTENSNAGRINAATFLSRHGNSEFVKQGDHRRGYHDIGVSILCTDQNIINDLITLDKNGKL